MSRKPGQQTAEELSKKDFKAALLEKEKQYFEKKYGKDSYFATAAAHLRIEGHRDGEEEPEVAVVAEEETEQPSLKSLFLKAKSSTTDNDEEMADINDKDESNESVDLDKDVSDSDSDSDDDSDDDSDEDDTAALLLELEKIKRERALEQEQRETLAKEKEEQARTATMLSSNPLLQKPGSADFTLKRKWYDDVIFKNQAKGVDESGKKKRFINDLIRSDFHRKFMDKYVK